MGETKTTLTWLLRDQVSGPAKSIEGALEKAGKAAPTGLMEKLGAATGGLVNPMSLALGAATGLFTGLLAAGKAAADEQINVQKMDAALKASIPGFTGNTDAIEALISKREDLGFSDDDLRNSMATLVTSTHDVKQAQDLQSLAMDLARLKGIDLATATDALAKANVGSTKELKALGITVDDTKDKTQVFAAIQHAASGQADAYAKTSAGKWETLQHRFGDVVETVGGAVLPIMNGLLDILLNNVIPAVQGLADVVGPILSGAFQIVGGVIGWFVDHVVKPALGIIGGLIDAIKGAIDWFTSLGVAQDKSAQQSSDYHATHHATGGYLGAGWNVVGEEGPELISPQGRVYTAPQTASMLGGSGGGSPVVIALHMDGREVARVVDEHLYYNAQRAAPAQLRS